MRSGRMDRSIVIEQFTETIDAYGARLENWSTLATVWAEVVEKGGKEFFVSDQRTSDVNIIFRIHFRSDITRRMRILYNGDYYDIKALKEIWPKRGLEIIAQGHFD